MNFNSYVFILLFLPLSLVGYSIINRINRRYSNIWLLAISLVFYAYAGVPYLILLLLSMVINYGISLLIRNRNGNSKIILGLGITCNIALLLYYKYFDFFKSSLNSTFGTDFVIMNLALPLGISFFSFSQIAWLVDLYKGEISELSFWEYALYVSWFPKLSQGPIALQEDLIPQFKDDSRKVWSWDRAFRGINLFVWGLLKKVLIADSLGSAVDLGFTDVYSLLSLDVWVIMIAYTFQIYFDFSGYCDMASGVSLLFGIELPINFDSPYKATSISDFWKRWHISLTSFFRKYLYFPLGGSREGKIRSYLNMIIVFTLSGFWHGAGTTFILWGLLHGVLQVLHRLFQKPYEKIIRPVKWLATFFCVNALWLLFRAESASQWWWMICKAFRLKYWMMTDSIAETFKFPRIRTIVSMLGIEAIDTDVYMWCMYVVFAVCLLLCIVPVNNQKREFKCSYLTLFITLASLIIMICMLSNVTSFLYFNF